MAGPAAATGQDGPMAATPAPGPPPGRVPAPVRRAVLGLLVLAFLGLGLHQAGRDAPTVDEGVDVSSGIVSLVRHDLRIVPEHPPLPKALAALPALLAHPVVPDTEAYRDGAWFDYSDDFIAANAAAGRLDDVLLWARAVVLLEAVACAGLLYVLAARWFGPDGGLLAAAAWLTTPYVVGLGHFAMIDVPFTLVTLASALALQRWREVPSTARTLQLGAVLGLALASRHTALVLVLVAVAVVAGARRRDLAVAAREVALLGLVAVAGVWLVYRGLAPAGPSGPVAARFDGLIANASSDSIVARLGTALPLPVEWRAGLAFLDLTSTPRPASLLGQSWDGGRWWYFPVSAVLKQPLPLTLAIVVGWASIAVAVLRGRRRAAPSGPGKPGEPIGPEDPALRVVDGRGLLLTVVLPAVVLWAFLLAQPLNLGLRLALPVLALSYVGLGALGPVAARVIGHGPRPVRVHLAAIGVVLVLAVQASSAVAAAPHSLAWMPAPFTPGLRWSSDANLDAGQALYEVRRWAEDHDEPYVAYDTTRGLEVGGGSRSLRGVDPTEVRGWVAVGVTPLMQTRRGTDVAKGELAWLRKYCAVGTLGGGSVLLYRFDDAPDPSPGPERPVAPCPGAAVSSAR